MEAVRLCVAYRNYMCGTILDLSKGTTANLQREHLLPSIRHDQCNNCYVQVGTREVTCTDDAEVQNGTKTLPLLRMITAKEVESDSDLNAALAAVRNGEAAPSGEHEDITAIVCWFETVVQHWLSRLVFAAPANARPFGNYEFVLESDKNYGLDSTVRYGTSFETNAADPARLHGRSRINR